VTTQIGTSFATALAGKDFAAVERLLADDIDFGALTPRMVWEMSTAKQVIADALTVWFGDGDDIEGLSSVNVRPVAGDRWHLSYQLRVRNEDGAHTVEQQAYYQCDAGRITWMRVLCAGYIPA
jgi:hypothetical protein